MIKEVAAVLIAAQAQCMEPAVSPIPLITKELASQGAIGRASLTGLNKVQVVLVGDNNGLCLKSVHDMTVSLKLSNPPEAEKLPPKVAIVVSKNLSGYQVSLSVFQKIVTEARPDKVIYLRTYYLRIAPPVAPLSQELNMLLDRFMADYQEANSGHVPEVQPPDLKEAI